MTKQTKASIEYLTNCKQFHLSNEQISYVFCVSEDGKLLQLYYGKRVPQDKDYTHLIERHYRQQAPCRKKDDLLYSLDSLKQELPEYGTSDYRHPAIRLRQSNGSAVSELVYDSYAIKAGKEALPGLPATYTEEPQEATTLKVHLTDELTGSVVEVVYTIFSELPVITRNVNVLNRGTEDLFLTHLMSLNLDLPDSDYEWLQLSGAWGRERHVKKRTLQQGIQSIESTRGISSPQQNPFVALARTKTTEFSGEVIGATLVYSGNFLVQAEVDTFDVTRLQLGINPFNFEWKLAPEESFVSPEAVLVYSDQGLNGMSQTFHSLFRKRLVRGKWRDQDRPVLINNWEATYFDFTEEKLLAIAEKAKQVGVELFVLDDGWFGQRTHEKAGLGDWYVNQDRLPDGIGALADKIRALDLKFGLWFEPEMVNLDSDLYRNHPDWMLHTPNRKASHGRHQYVLNYANPDVVDNIFQQMCLIIDESKLEYIKWDMNRVLSEVYAVNLPADRQGEVFHRYVLGVYDLYERLATKYPNILFESCSSGGGRFDAGMLYYAPQAWTSDDTDAMERLKIQYGTSFLYPLSSMGSHVSVIPNHQTNRLVPLNTRANVAYFGTFGYELDLSKLSDAEIAEVKEQVDFFKKYQSVFHDGTFYRIQSPFEKNRTETSWMVVSEDQTIAIAGYYKMLNEVNRSFHRMKLQGLKGDWEYVIDGTVHSGAELMHAGLVSSDASSGFLIDQTPLPPTHDYDSRLWIIEKA
ncbi:alpha-galactosidase [Enterococcus florum]|uniref:Alpha-galactosidase n=1 Tax=Enterococcus florum TaxID=2480627 RepID=A0A4P5P450_9ENTE|nr:alpha-galactosidase [Enterococcus florum]GCF92565.1 alpha-galactosidase [Enterococcus florum]